MYNPICEHIWICAMLSHSVMSSSLRPHGMQPARLFVHGIFQAGILERVAISFFRGSSWPRNWTCVSCVFCIAGRFFICWAIGEALCVCVCIYIYIYIYIYIHSQFLKLMAFKELAWRPSLFPLPSTASCQLINVQISQIFTLTAFHQSYFTLNNSSLSCLL